MSLPTWAKGPVIGAIRPIRSSSAARDGALAAATSAAPDSNASKIRDWRKAMTVLPWRIRRPFCRDRADVDCTLKTTCAATLTSARLGRKPNGWATAEATGSAFKGPVHPCFADMARHSAEPRGCGIRWANHSIIPQEYCDGLGNARLYRPPHGKPRGLDGLCRPVSRHAARRQEPRHRHVPDGRQKAASGGARGRRRCPGLLRMGGRRRRRARRLCGQPRAPQGAVRARLPRARRRAQGARPDRAVRPRRQPAGNLPRRRDHHRSVQARPRHLRLPHRPARHGPCRAPLREDRRHPAVLPGHPRLPPQRLLHQAVLGLLLPRQSAPPQRGLHRVRARPAFTISWSRPAISTTSARATTSR